MTLERGTRLPTRLLVSAVMLAPLAITATLAAQISRPDPNAVSRRILTFYYPWYGITAGPGGAGRVIHWGRIDAAAKNIEASTHYPAMGAYDSHDLNVIDRHCRWAKQAGIDTFIVSWWGHGHYTDRAMPRILDACVRHSLTACIYYETVPRPQTPKTAADDIVKILNKYGPHDAHLKINGKPVVFIYGRAIEELGLAGWLEAVTAIKAEYRPGATIIGDQFSYGAARVFDGVHTYNTAGSLAGLAPAAVEKWAAPTYQSCVQLADQAGKISTLTVIPGYDDTKIRKPGLAVDRFDGALYRLQWQQAVKADPHWILITSFNEWHEGSEIEPSLEFGERYLALTVEYATLFKQTRRTTHAQTAPGQITPQEKMRLAERLKHIRIGVLPGAESMAFWWLLDIGIKPDILTWEQLVGGNLSARQYPIILYCSGERYRTTVNRPGDVDEALINYLKSGGLVAFFPSLPWPFFYDENGRPAERSSRFGLTLRIGWENPPANTALVFMQPKRLLPHVPEELPFPAAGDRRWRPSFADRDVSHISVLQLRDNTGSYLGDAVAYTEPKTGGKILYTWFTLLNTPLAEPLLYDLFDLMSQKVP